MFLVLLLRTTDYGLRTTDSLGLIQKLLQPQFHHFAALGTSSHGFGKLHIRDAGWEIRELDGRPRADGIHEIRLDPPRPSFLGRNRDLPEGLAFTFRARLGTASTQNAVGG